MRIYDFRRDTVTLPTEAMMGAVDNAPLGNSVPGKGRTTRPTFATLGAVVR